ncbi:MAG: nuclear transport factor 2 family protein [Cellvibrionaceae bacterium]
MQTRSNIKMLEGDPIVAFKRFYQQFDQHSLDLLGDIYSENVTFSDPVHMIQGLQVLKSYFEGMCGNLSHCRFEFIDEVVGENNACFKWEMHYSHPSLKSNAPLKLIGATFIEYSDKIDAHEDFYDMGAMLYEHLPVLGSAVRLVKSRIQKDSEKK